MTSLNFTQYLIDSSFDLSVMFVSRRIEYDQLLFSFIFSYTNIYQNQKVSVMIDWKMTMIMYHVHVELNDENRVMFDQE
jgi:hypothetical protein